MRRVQTAGRCREQRETRPLYSSVDLHGTPECSHFSQQWSLDPDSGLSAYSTAAGFATMDTRRRVQDTDLFGKPTISSDDELELDPPTRWSVRSQGRRVLQWAQARRGGLQWAQARRGGLQWGRERSLRLIRFVRTNWALLLLMLGGVLLMSTLASILARTPSRVSSVCVNEDVSGRMPSVGDPRDSVSRRLTLAMADGNVSCMHAKEIGQPYDAVAFGVSGSELYMVVYAVVLQPCYGAGSELIEHRSIRCNATVQSKMVSCVDVQYETVMGTSSQGRHYGAMAMCLQHMVKVSRGDESSCAENVR
jgi:hypothetical protein